MIIPEIIFSGKKDDGLMRKKQYIRRRHKYFVLLILEIIGTWFLTVLVIQYCTSTQQPVKNTIPVSRFVRPDRKSVV